MGGFERADTDYMAFHVSGNFAYVEIDDNMHIRSSCPRLRYNSLPCRIPIEFRTKDQKGGHLTRGFVLKC